MVFCVLALQLVARPRFVADTLSFCDRYADHTFLFHQDGFTVILVERSDAVTTRSIKTSYSASAGTGSSSHPPMSTPP